MFEEVDLDELRENIKHYCRMLGALPNDPLFYDFAAAIIIVVLEEVGKEIDKCSKTLCTER